MASSNQPARDYVRNAHENLVGHLQNLPLIVEKLLQQNVFNGREVSEIEAEPEKYNRTKKILDLVLNKGEEACYQFLRILDRERKSVFPKLDLSSQTPDLHTWISLFSFSDEPEDDYIQGPVSCHQLQKDLKTRTKQILGQQWKQSLQFYGGKAQENFTFIPLVLDTETEKNKAHTKIILKSKKSKKSRSKKMKAYIPRDTRGKSPEDLLNSREKSILIVGKPGIGKTAVVQQMLHHWAERHDRNLDFVFYFDENTLSNTSTIVSLENLLLSTFLMSNPQLKENAEEILQHLQEYSERVTIAFDGIRDFQDNTILLGIMQHELLPEAKIVATCRPEVEDELSDWPTCKVYVKGFSEESIYDFFRKMSDNDPDLVDSVINNPALFSLCHVPMFAFMTATWIAYYTSEEAQKPCTTSELYVRIFRHCLQRHGNKKLRHLDGHIKNCRDTVLSLAESAFSATKLKTNNLEFDYDEKGIAGVFLRSVSVGSPAHARTFCAFLHNTMQEFFSALWLLEKTEILDEVLHLCQNEDSKHMKHVIPFLCGLQSQTNIDHLKCLFPLNKVKENIDGFFEKVLNTFLHDEPDEETVDIAFICQCLYEFQSPETCCSFLERINYHLDLSEERLDPYTCYAVSYVISQSSNQQVHLDLENSTVSLSGLKTIFKHSQCLRDLSTTLCQVWTVSLKHEQLDYLIQLLQLLGNELHLLMSSDTGVLKQAGKIITRSAEQINLYLHCDKDPHQLTNVPYDTVFSWLPHIGSVQFYSEQGEKEQEKRWRTFKLDLCLQAVLHQPQNFWQTVQKVMPFYYKKETDFLLALYSHVKQYESKTGRSVLPALLPVYQSLPAVWSIKLSERKASLLLEVLKLQTEKKPVELRDCSDEESEVRSFLQCLPYISQLRFKEFDSDSASIRFFLNLSIAAVDCQSDKGESFTELLASVCSYSTFPFGDEFDEFQEEQSDFLLDLCSHVKQYESNTGRSVLPALLPVYQSAPEVWYINLSERKVSLLLEVLKLQTEKKPVELRDCSDEESEVRSFLQCLPYISQLRFKEYIYKKQKHAEFLMSLLHHTTESDRHTGGKSLELLTSLCTHRSFPYGQSSMYNSDFLLDLYSHVKQYESNTGRSVLPALLPVYQSLPAVWSIKLSERKASLLLELLKLQTEKKPVELRDYSDEESEVRSFLQCLPYISQLRFKEFYSGSASIQFLLNLSIAAVDCQSDKGESFTELLASVCSYSTFPFGEEVHGFQERQSDFLLDLCSHVKQYESNTGRSVLPALLPVYQSLPAVWSIKLSERKASLLLEVLKLQTEKKLVVLRDCSGEESEVRSFLQCLPYISQLRFKEFYSGSASIQIFLNLSIAAVDCQSDKGESFTELLASVCSYSTFPFGVEVHGFQERQSDLLLDLCSHVKQYESSTGRSVLPALLPVYQSLPAVWSIKLSERKASLLLEVLKLQTEKKPVELRGCSGEESEVRSFLQCLPYISQLRCEEKLIPRLSKAVVDYAEDTELVRAFFAAVDFIFIIDWVLTTRECRAVRKVLNLSDSKLKLTLKPRAISLRGVRLLFRHITHLQKLCLSDRVVGRMVRAFRAVRAGGSLVIEELCLGLNSIKPKKEIFTFLSSLSSLLNIWTVHCVNLTECRMEAHSLISLMCHPGNLNIRLSKATLQQFTGLLCEAQDGELTRFFLEKVGGDLTSCSLSWEELIYLLQQRVCRISVNIRKSKITYKHARQILPLLSEIQFKRLNPGVVLSIIREIYETGSAHCVSSLLSSTHSCINLNNTELDSYHCTALCFTLQHCTSVSLSLLWTSIPEGELVKILPLFNRVSQLSVDRLLLLKLLHCCSISELQQGAAAVVLALQNRLDFSCSTGLDLSTETQDNTLHLTTEDCRDISTAIQKSHQLTELILEDCEMEDTGVDMFFLILHTVRLRCSKPLLLRFLDLLHVVNESDCVRRVMSLSQALDGQMDLSETPLDLHACRSLALFLEFSEGLSELDLSHCQLAHHGLELLFPHLHKAAVLDLSHNDIDDPLAGRIYTVVSSSSNIQTVRLFSNRITDIERFRKDKRFEIW
ncbi:uncharacterized protein LOC113523961 isoform X2 [Pangasianodon hypophthalmus]|uniref:uncharacterized protein LOC113523961 isoform X2 n=1 Tax=Pangasianodon hypophthalmus TaxID=310915 RepID=UPI002307F034|nr:uncharacterized protein LOC113523961 isoform X2 [Pangasianodon hypophthalmus]